MRKTYIILLIVITLLGLPIPTIKKININKNLNNTNVYSAIQNGASEYRYELGEKKNNSFIPKGLKMINKALTF